MPNLSLPGNPRYQPANLIPYFGYDNIFRYVAEVEIASIKALVEIGVIPIEDFDLLTPELEEKLKSITTTQVDERERAVTNHDIRAWVQLAQEILPPRLARWVHVLLTSYDPLDTARSLQFVSAHKKVVSPLVKDVIRQLSAKARASAQVLQIGRTHGQHALPITVGFWLATILNRVVANAQEMDRFAMGLRGKISGAVGAYNAQVGLGIAEKCGESFTFETKVLDQLGLNPAPISTQIMPPEPLAYYLFSASMLSAALAQFGRDCRHLMRTEIGEIGEPFDKGQVGSSTMAHKRNPINFENLEGTWLRTKNEFGKVFDSLISEHQRDLVGSSIARDYPVIVVNLVQQLNTLLRKKKGQPLTFLERLSIDEDRCAKNFQKQSNVILAEPVYIALQMAGYEGDAHELVNHKAVPFARDDMQVMRVLYALAKEDEKLREALGRIPPEIAITLERPEAYTGAATEKTIEICDKADLYAQSA